MKEFANAKVNLGLDIVGEREDGYHLLDMVMVPLALGDDIDIEISDTDIFTSNTSLGWDKGNLMYKAVELMRQECGIKEHFKIDLFKRIPMQAGLAGGSADCAAVMRAVNVLCDLGLSEAELMKLGVRLGADVPYCIFNKPARVQGIGEVVSPIEIKKNYHILLVKPEEGVSTKEVYQLYDSTRHVDIDQLVRQLSAGEKLSLGNVLEDSAFKLLPEIEAIKLLCITMGCESSLMSGSGSCVFAVSENIEDLVPVFSYFKNIYNFVLMSEIVSN